jgi:hypothetical protein
MLKYDTIVYPFEPLYIESTIDGHIDSIVVVDIFNFLRNSVVKVSLRKWK